MHPTSGFIFMKVSFLNNKNKLNSTYVYRHKHNYIFCSMFTITKVQLHVSVIQGRIKLFGAPRQ